MRAPPPSPTTVVFDRPPEGLAQGSYVWPAWGVLLLVVAVAVLSGAWWLRSRGNARRKGESDTSSTKTERL